MRSAHTVPDQSVSRKSAPRRAFVQVVTGDIFGLFARETLQARPKRLTIVSPWVDSDFARAPSLNELLDHAEQCKASVALATRPLETPSHARAVASVLNYRRGRVFLDPNLHAKLYVCEEADGRGFAVVGSANMTDSAQRLRELAVVVRPQARSRVLADLGDQAVATLTASAEGARRQRRRSAPPFRTKGHHT
jgi:phosphatidylserine/phosphatidylglycerophosphate/cardiolipin synthase-like enzyme